MTVNSDRKQIQRIVNTLEFRLLFQVILVFYALLCMFADFIAIQQCLLSGAPEPQGKLLPLPFTGGGNGGSFALSSQWIKTFTDLKAILHYTGLARTGGANL